MNTKFLLFPTLVSVIAICSCPTGVQGDQTLTAITNYKEVTQGFLNILIGKAGLLNDLPLIGPPMAQVLRSFEATNDNLFFDYATINCLNTQQIQNLQGFTSLVQQLYNPAQSINLLSGPLFLIGQGPFPIIITGLVNIISNENTENNNLQGKPAVDCGNGDTSNTANINVLKNNLDITLDQAITAYTPIV